jgi:hypothetical protein
MMYIDLRGALTHVTETREGSHDTTTTTTEGKDELHYLAIALRKHWERA